ncbi:MAG: OmpH family outer membrane protein [Planctomycetota bacterium]
MELDRAKPGILLGGAALLVLAVAAGGVALRDIALGSGVEAGAAARVVVVDMEAVLEASIRRQELEAEINALLDEKKAALSELKKEYNQLKGEIALVKPGSEEHDRLQRAILVKETDLKFANEQSRGAVERRWLDARQLLDQEIDATLAALSDRQGFDVVLPKQLPTQEGLPSLEMVLYHRPEHDVTSLVIEMMNGNR